MTTPNSKTQKGLATTLAIFFQLLRMHGVDPTSLTPKQNASLSEPFDPAARISIDQIDALVRAAIPLIHDDTFGLKAARCWHPSSLGVLGHAWLSCSTLRSGLQRLTQYYRLIGERGTLEVEESRSGLITRFWANRGDPAKDPTAAALIDIVMAVLLDMCRFNAGAALRPISATLRRQAPDKVGAYEQFFGCPITFNAPENTFTLANADADRALPTSNRQLAIVFDQMLAEELARLDKSDVVARCRASVLESLSSGEGAEDTLAKALHMSPRTLQRKLALENTSYQQLVDETRKDLALRYIEDPRMSLNEIAFALGFSQQSAFTRAFKRWTDQAPSEFRSRIS